MILQQNSAEITYGSLNRELDVRVASAWTEEVGQSSASSWVLSMDQTQEVTQQLTTVDGWNPANQLRLVVYPIIYRVLYIPLVV